MRTSMILASVLALSVGCGTSELGNNDTAAQTDATTGAGPTCSVASASPDCGLAPAALVGDARRRAEQLTSLFENRTLELRYDYIESLGDGRGYTAGRAGFTTGTGDLLDVVERYTNQVGDNPLSPYLPRLRALAAAESASITGLTGFPAAWRAAAADEAQRAVQDAVVNDDYYSPAMNAAACTGAMLPLSKAFLYDTVIQHGDGDDADSMGSILERTRRAVHGTPSSGVDELVWLRALMTERRKDLARACAASTRKEWADSVDRVDAFRALLDAGALNLDGPLSVPLDGGVISVP